MFSPVCICNWKEHDTMNKKILQHASSARLVQRTMAPRPMMDNRCTTHRAYQPTETIASHTTPSNRTPTTKPPPTVHQQFAQLADVHSQLKGLCRSSAYNSTPIPVSPIARDSEVWEAFHVPSVAHLHLRTTSTTTPSTPCFHTTASAQTRSPYMQSAPQCKPTKAEDDVHLWQNNSAYLTEQPRWNNHPYLLDHRAVRRHLYTPPLPSPMQNPFKNSTRRKLNIK